MDGAPTLSDTNVQSFQDAPAVGTQLGRFHLLQQLGVGGMGIVYAAYDPELDRKVAIKLLRTRGLTAERRERETARLLAEARAMAQLSHPNVVTVYQVGAVGEPASVFIAMEYVAGLSLRDWLADRPRTIADILDVFVKAGRGLAAGHQAGLIHRDFKPENVLVGFDGRTRVIDFGLARAPGISTRPPDENEPVADDLADRAPIASSEEVSTIATVFGTPLYMAPEQHARGTLDARCDQFAFCIALYEALYRELPFAHRNYGELVEAVNRGALREPPVRSDIAPRIRAAVIRGLARDPDRRFSTMTELLGELVPPVARRPARIVAAIAITGVVAVGGTAAVMRVIDDDSATDRCGGGESQLVGVWDSAVKIRVIDGLLASRRRHAATTAERAAGELDRYAANWVAERRSVCEASERGEQSAAALDLRMSCLRDRRGELGELAKLLATVDPETADNAVTAVGALGSLRACGGLVPGDQALSIPDALKAAHAEVAALKATGKPIALLAKARHFSELANATNDQAVVADAALSLVASFRMNNNYRDAERTARDGLRAAHIAKNDTLVADLWLSLIATLASQPARYGEVLALREVAELAIERAGGPVALMRSELATALGLAHLTKGDYPLAIAAFETARDRHLEYRPAGDNETGKLYSNLGGAYLRTGNVLAAKLAFEQSIALIERINGPHHPDLALPLGNLGGLAQALGDFDGASALQQRALAILSEVRTADDEQIGQLVYGLGVSANGREDYRAAVPYYERALAVFEKLAPDHPMVGLTLVGLADCREEIGDAVRAVPEAERGLRLVEASSKDAVQLALARYALAKALWSAGRDRTRALALAHQARDGFASGGLAALNGVAAVDKWLAKVQPR